MTEFPLRDTPEHLLWTVLRMIGVTRFPEFTHESGSSDTWYFASIDGQDAAVLEIYAEEGVWPTVHDVHVDLHHPVIADAVGIGVTDYPYATGLVRAGKRATFPKQGERTLIGETWFDLRGLTIAQVPALRSAFRTAKRWSGLIGHDQPTILTCGSRAFINGQFMEQQVALRALTGKNIEVELPLSA